MPKPKSVTYDQAEFRRLVHLNQEIPLDGMAEEDRQACELIGLFFANNAWLAEYAIFVEEITLVPRGDGEPPTGHLRIVNPGGREYWLCTDESGRVPAFERMRRRIIRRWG